MQPRSVVRASLAFVFLLSACQSAQTPTVAPSPETATSTTQAVATATSMAEPATYLLHGISPLTLDTELPASPGSVSVFLAHEPSPLTLEAAQAIAARFGMQGRAYENPVQEVVIFMEGNRSLYVSSGSSFMYYPATPNSWTAVERPDQATAEDLIADFLDEFHFEGEYQVMYSEPHTGYFAILLSEDGLPIRRDHFWGSGLLFTFRDGQIASAWAELLTYEAVGTYGIISAEEAFEKMIGPYWYGTLDANTSGAWPEAAWTRSYPLNETIEVFGALNSVAAIDGGQPLLTFDGYPLLGEMAAVPDGQSTYAKATGHYEIQNGTQVFVLESWVPYVNEGYVGTLQQQGDDVVLVTDQGEVLQMPDVPADVPLPLESVYVVGALVGDTLEWNAFDLRMAGGSGGGGGGGMGFFQLNLSGTGEPLPPTPTAEPPLIDPTYELPIASIERVELVHFIPSFHRLTGTEPLYIQPVWRFAGHWSTGEVFEIMVQALSPEFLSPEIQLIEPAG